MRILNKVLDSSLLFSFDRSGFLRHALEFNAKDLKVKLDQKVCLITGGNSGLGFETAKKLTSLGAKVILVCRNREKGQKALQRIGPAARLEILDVSDLDAIAGFVTRLKEIKIDILIHNAGTLPETRVETPQRVELVFATHVLGPFLLTRLLLPNLLRSANARVIWVSSGGMYGKKLDLDTLQSTQKNYDGVTAYANAKRAQVILTELWRAKFRSKNPVFNSMHPGWAATPGVKQSLPRFWQLMKNRLRTSKEGADTAIWLAACQDISLETGHFWFDRKIVATHLVPWTRESEKDRNGLWTLCCRMTQPYVSSAALQQEEKAGVYF